MARQDSPDTSQPLRSPVKPPDDASLPFFAYGIFKNNEIAWPRISGLVSRVEETDLLNWSLAIRNGLPILQPNQGFKVKGDVVHFNDPDSAYEIIRHSEPRYLYTWEKVAVQSGATCNALVGKSSAKGFSEERFESWTSALDPSFLHGMAYVYIELSEVCNERLPSNPWREAPDDWNNFFRLQGAFLVLWSIVERLAAFRFGNRTNSKSGQGSVQSIDSLGDLEEFRLAIAEANIRKLSVVRADGTDVLSTHSTSDCSGESVNPTGALSTWYQFRSNITHRGKSAHTDNERVLTAGIDLYNTIYFYMRSVIPEITRTWTTRGVESLRQERAQTESEEDLSDES